jgi:hypothetical protein
VKLKVKLSTQVQDHVTHKNHAEDPKEWPNIEGNIQSNNLPRTDGEQITTDSAQSIKNIR